MLFKGDYCSIAGYFWGGNFSWIGLCQIFEGENVINCQEHLVIDMYSKYFESKIFANGNWFVEFVKCFPLKKPAIRIYGIKFKSAVFIQVPYEPWPYLIFHCIILVSPTWSILYKDVCIRCGTFTG